MQKWVLLGLAASATFAALGEARAYVNYPWCIITGGGSRQCNYASREECGADSSRGFGSLCIQNPGYQAPPSATDRGAQVKQRKSSKRATNR